jgi:hypothetical protein
MHQGRLDPRRLVFIDETWAKTNMTRRYGRRRRGARLVAKAATLPKLVRPRLDLVDHGTPLPLEIERPPAGSSNCCPAVARLSSGNENSQARYSELTRNRAGLSNTEVGMNVTLIAARQTG